MNPRATITMATRPVDWQRTNGSTSYAQLPSAPRLLHYLLLGAGLRDLSWQTLVISLLGTALTAALLWRLFGQPALLVVPLAVVFDHAGFLAWTLNASRVWMFALFFGLVLAAQLNRQVWFGALAFCLIQLDFRIATFVGVTAIVFALLVHQWSGWRLLLYGAAGAALPLAIFCLEVLLFYGWADLQHEFAIARAWIGTLTPDESAVQYVYQAAHGPILLLQTIARETHSGPVFVLVVGGIIASLFALTREKLADPHRFVAYLAVSATFGTVVASSTLYTPFVEGFGAGELPLASFLVAPVLGAIAMELRNLPGRASKSPHVGISRIWNPWEYSWLTGDATDPRHSVDAYVYSHNPNAPRYFHYLLLRLGVRELAWHVLVISVIATGLTMAILWRLFGQPAVVAVPLAVALDYAGFLAWTVNTYRSGPRRLLAGLLLSTTAGAMVTSALLYGYFVDAYVVSLLPCGVFLVALATGVVAVEIYDVTARLSRSEAVANWVSLTALVPVVVASVMLFRPPVTTEYMSLLRTAYRDQTIIGPRVEAWLFAPELAFVLMGAMSVRTASIEATPEDIERLSALRESDGTLTYACLDTLYICKMAKVGEPSVCEIAASRMLQRGHQVVAEGFGWVVMRINSEDRPANAELVETSPENAARWVGPGSAHAP